MGRLMLWTIPRSKSTIALRILSNNSETKAIFEPFPFAYFSKYYDYIFTYNHLMAWMKQEPFTSDNIVWKDVPDFVQNHEFEKWVTDKSVKHVLLIRNPRGVCLSKVTLQGNRMFFMHVPKQLTEHPTVTQNFEAMTKLLRYLKTNGFDYRVINAEDLTQETGEVLLRDVCQFAGLPFKEEMMKLTEIEEFPDTWWLPTPATSKLFTEGVAFHENALSATSLRPAAAQTEIEDSQLSETDRTALYNFMQSCKLYYDNLKEEVKPIGI